MRIVAIADEESMIGGLGHESVDLLISLGDMDDAAIERAVERCRPKRTFAVRGNHDPNIAFPLGVTDLHLSVQIVEGIRFGGFAGSWKYKPRGHHLFEQEEVSRLMQDFPPVDVFIAHNSPSGIHERDNEVHQGFHGFVDYIRRAKPRLFLHGHQHVSHTTLMGSTTIVGVFGERVIFLG